MTILSVVTLLILIMDPFGNMVLFNSILKGIPTKRKTYILLRESIIAYIIMLIFLFFGEKILGHLHVKAPALGIGGGIILFLIALGMVFPSKSMIAPSNDEENTEEPFIVPIAIPFIAGPSTIATLLLLVSTYPDRVFDWFIAITVAAAISLIILVLSPVFLSLLKKKGTKAVERLMGLILIIVSVQMLLNGIKEYLHSL